MPKKLSTTPVSDWIKRKEFRINRPWRIGTDGIMRTQVGKVWMTAREFDKQFPVKTPMHFYGNPENPDKTKSFIYDK